MKKLSERGSNGRDAVEEMLEKKKMAPITARYDTMHE